MRVVTEPASRSRPDTIEVIDTGIGISPPRLAAFSTSFEPADTATGRRYGGTGLGLPISRSLCELLGYELRVQQSVEGRGSTFSDRNAGRENRVAGRWRRYRLLAATTSPPIRPRRIGVSDRRRVNVEALELLLHAGGDKLLTGMIALFSEGAPAKLERARVCGTGRRFLGACRRRTLTQIERRTARRRSTSASLWRKSKSSPPVKDRGIGSSPRPGGNRTELFPRVDAGFLPFSRARNEKDRHC